MSVSLEVFAAEGVFPEREMDPASVEDWKDLLCNQSQALFHSVDGRYSLVVDAREGEDEASGPVIVFGDAGLN